MFAYANFAFSDYPRLQLLTDTVGVSRFIKISLIGKIDVSCSSGKFHWVVKATQPDKHGTSMGWMCVVRHVTLYITSIHVCHTSNFRLKFLPCLWQKKFGGMAQAINPSNARLGRVYYWSTTIVQSAYTSCIHIHCTVLPRMHTSISYLNVNESGEISSILVDPAIHLLSFVDGTTEDMTSWVSSYWIVLGTR